MKIQGGDRSRTKNIEEFVEQGQLKVQEDRFGDRRGIFVSRLMELREWIHRRILGIVDVRVVL
jgi:hypothetical protein